ncbi:MAG: metal-dependent hydrolase [Flavobacteriales bacterium]|nr:metal-dependent hydrolase [Flavobacteriales bacterium]
MDSITQAALGGAIGQAVLGKQIGNKGAILGAIVATIPDLDIVLLSFYDSVERISIHRGYSHSILFSVLGAFLISFLLSKIKWTRQVSIWRLLIFSWITLITHMLLDAFTTYGTQLFLPFSDIRLGFDSINIVDPFYTIPLLLGLILSFSNYNKGRLKTIFNKAGIILSTLYLLSTLCVKEYVKKNYDRKLKASKIDYNALLTVPVGIGSINWYGVAKSKDSLFIAKYSIFKNTSVHFEGYPVNDTLLQTLKPNLVEKMKWFAKGFYTVSKHHEKIHFYNLQVDMRGAFKNDTISAPTLGYFAITPISNGDFTITYETHKK